MQLLQPVVDLEGLLERAQSIAGINLRTLAHRLGCDLPQDLQRHKGWVGQLIEKSLGATAGSRPEPDFPSLGIELKTLPINAQGKPRESTFVCYIDLLNLNAVHWQDSLVYKKLAKVLWIPIEADPSIAIADRLIGSAILWSPKPTEEKILKQDWQELTDLMAMGKLESITARQGRFLQVRPKAAHGRALRWGIGEDGQRILTMPRGFYLRTCFTEQILL